MRNSYKWLLFLSKIFLTGSSSNQVLDEEISSNLINFTEPNVSTTNKTQDLNSDSEAAINTSVSTTETTSTPSGNSSCSTFPSPNASTLTTVSSSVSSNIYTTSAPVVTNNCTSTVSSNSIMSVNSTPNPAHQCATISAPRTDNTAQLPKFTGKVSKVSASQWWTLFMQWCTLHSFTEAQILNRFVSSRWYGATMVLGTPLRSKNNPSKPQRILLCSIWEDQKQFWHWWSTSRWVCRGMYYSNPTNGLWWGHPKQNVNQFNC